MAEYELKVSEALLSNLLGGGKAEAARSLGTNANMLRRWVKEYEADEGQAFRGNGKLTPEQEELRRLRREVRQLKLEREILKKATAFSMPFGYFAKESD